MPLYLVRWPGLEASIVRADDEEQLTDILDQEASPTGAWWTGYDGPLWVDIGLGVQAQRKEDDSWSLRGVETAASEPLLGATARDGDNETGCEMFESIFAEAFPNLAQLYLMQAPAGRRLAIFEVTNCDLKDRAAAPHRAAHPVHRPPRTKAPRAGLIGSYLVGSRRQPRVRRPVLCVPKS